MGLSRYIEVRTKELTVIGLCLLCCTLAFPTKGHRGGGAGGNRGVIPLGLFMSQLQVDMPDYETEALNTARFTGGAKRKRHGHLNFHTASKKTQSEEKDAEKSCCPVVEEIVEPIGGKSKSGMLVELFQTEDLRQQFHEISCAPEVADQTCRFVNETYLGQSRCVQQYSYSYALVRDFGASDNLANPQSGWRFEHIRVRSGCSCIISPS